MLLFQHNRQHRLQQVQLLSTSLIYWFLYKCRMSMRRAAFLFLRVSLRGRRPKQSTRDCFALLAMTTVALLAMTTVAHGQVTKVDPLVHIFAKQAEGLLLPSGARNDTLASKAISVNASGQKVIDCFVQVYDPAKAEVVADRLQSIGGQARSIIDNIMTAFVPLDAIDEVSSWEEVKYIEAGKPLLPKMDVARTVTNVDDVNAGTDLDARYDCSGVIIGVVDDTAPDWGHEDFKDSAGKTRVQFFWDKSASGSGVSEISGSSGLECTNTQMNNSLSSATTNTCGATSGGDTSSHSTHVAGIAAGDDSTYKGVATGADIIFVYNTETDADSGGNLSTTIVDDVRYVFAKASSLKQPAVVNLSLGTSIGAHDDTSSMETSLNNLVSGHPGRAIVNAAGNENFSPNDTGAATYNGLHAAIDVTSGSDEAFDFSVRSGSTLRSLGLQVIVDIWLASTSTCTVELDGFDFAKTAVSVNMAAASAGGSKTASGGSATLAVDFTDSTNANNGKKHAIATATFASSLTNAQIQDNFSFDLIFRGTCAGDAWLWPDRNSTVSFTKQFGGTDRGFGYTYVNGDSNRTITIPGSASKIIAVASFMSQTGWTDSTGTTHNQTATSGTDFTSLGATGGTVSDISLFSSLGPTPDGRTKPDIAAPGEPIVSALSSSNSVSSGKKVNSNHFKLEGTSMSSPHVAGIVALMFQKNKCLTSNQVKTLLTENAATDSFTGTGSSIPNNEWGYGKADALATMKDVATLSGETCGLTGTGGAQDTPVTTTSGTAAGSGCLNIANGNPNTLSIFCWVVVVFLGLTFRNRFTTE